MARNSLIKFVPILSIVIAMGCHSSGSSKEAASKGNSDTVLSIAPYQNSAITLVSPDGKNTKAATFQKFTGELTMKKDSPSAVKFAVQTNSVATSDKKLVSVLQDKNLFNSEKFPVAEFQSTEIKKNTSPGALPNQYFVDGSLNIRGEKIKMSVPANMDVTEKEVSMMIQLSISQKDWMDQFSTSPHEFFKDHMDVVAKLVFPKPDKNAPVQQPVVTTPATVEVKKVSVTAAKKEEVQIAPVDSGKSSSKVTNPKKGK